MIDAMILLDMQKHVLNHPNLLITVGGIVQADNSVLLNEEVRVNTLIKLGD